MTPSNNGTIVEDLQPSRSNPTEGRRERMVRWILQHSEFDLPATKGRVIFDLGRRPGSGQPAVAGTFHPTGEELT